MHFRLVAMLGLATGLIAAPALAMGNSPTAHHRHHHVAGKPGVHLASRHAVRGHRYVASGGDSQNAEVDRLNAMSLQSARQGASFAAPGTAAGAPPQGGSIQGGQPAPVQQ